MLRFAVYGASTSGVEQNFSVASWAMGALRRRCGDTQECNNIKIAVDLKSYDQPDLIRRAQKVYVEYYGESRNPQPNGRITRGVPLKRIQEDTETHFIKTRREATRHGASQERGHFAAPALNTKQIEECAHQSDVLLRQFRAAMQDGLLLPHEIPDDILAGMKALDDAQAKTTKARTTKYKAIDKALAEKAMTQLSICVMYVKRSRMIIQISTGMHCVCLLDAYMGVHQMLKIDRMNSWLPFLHGHNNCLLGWYIEIPLNRRSYQLWMTRRFTLTQQSAWANYEARGSRSCWPETKLMCSWSQILAQLL